MTRSRPLARFLVLLAAAGSAAASLTSWNSAAEVDPSATTLARTILDVDGDGRFEYAAGEPIHVREELADAITGRETRREALASFVGFADLQLADEESPLRGPWADLCGQPPTSAAFRPQESMVPHLINSNIVAASAIASGPVTGRPFDFGIQLGDAADNAQRNETRLFIDLLDGGVLVDPDSGNPDVYEGPQGQDPWPSPVPGRSILDLANDPFFATGLRRANGEPVPWYSVLGNHDAKVQGTVPNLPGWWEFARLWAQGPVFLRSIGPDHLQTLCADPSVITDPAFLMQLLARPGATTVVTPDASRETLTRNQWAAEHLPPDEAKQLDPAARGSDGGLPAGHGFLEPRCTDADGNPLPRLCYSYDAAGIHFIVLDTNPDEGLEGGNLDAQQLAWLERELIARSSHYYEGGDLVANDEAEDRLIVVFSHHTKDSMDESFPVNLKTTDHPPHERLDDDGRAFGEDVAAMLHRFPNVVLHAAGHTHENRVWPRPGVAASEGKPATGYWEVNSSSHADWPHQSRTIEIVDNADGTLSIFGVMFDAAAPPEACLAGQTDDCIAWEEDATDETAIQPSTPKINEEYLAAVAREVGFHDPQAGLAADQDARGRENALEPGPSQDRNVELLLPNPLFASAGSTKDLAPVEGGKLPGSFSGGTAPGNPFAEGPATVAPAPASGSSSSPFTRTYGSRHVESPATRSALPDWALASASLLLAASTAMFWTARTRVRDWMVGVPPRGTPLR